MISWTKYRTERTISEMGMAAPSTGGGGGGIIDKAEQEIERHFADFQNKMMQALGQKKDSWLSWGTKKLGSSLTGDERAQKSPHYGVRGALGSMVSKAGEWLRPRTAMEKKYKVDQAAAEATEEIMGLFLAENRKRFAQVQLAENTIPDWIEELKAKVRATVEKSLGDMYRVMSQKAANQPTPVKQSPKQAALTQLVAKYGSVEAVPPEEILSTLGHKPLVKGGFGAATKKALAGLAPVAKPITDPRQIGYE